MQSLHISCVQNIAILPTNFYLNFINAFMTIASIRIISIGFGFTILGRGTIPQPEVTAISIKHLGKVDTTSLHKTYL